METFIIADSDAMEAEYGSRDETAPFTVIGLYDGEIFTVYGVNSIKEGKAELIDNGAEASQISYL
jgi:hypothetical protein